MFKNKIKKILPLWVLNNLKSENLHMDDEFLSYVYKKKMGLEKNLGNIKTLALRGSHADYSIYSKPENGIYNLGLTSTDTYFNYKLYEKYSNKMDNLENVIFFYSVFTPGLSLIRIKEKYRLVSYKFFFGIPYQDENLINKDLESKIIKRCGKFKELNFGDEYYGYEKKNQFMTDITPEQRTTTHLRENQREPNQLEWLISLIDLVKHQKRKIYIVIPPVKKSYMECLPNKDELFEKLYSLDLSNVVILDFYGSEIFDDSDLGDFDHMNEKGAIKLTKEIINNIS